MYSEQVLEHFRNPRNVGVIKDADGFGKAGGEPKCPEDTTYFWIRVSDDHLVEVKHKTIGCPVAIASSSITSVMAEGKTIQEALSITPQTVIEALGGIPERKMDSNLGPYALHRAIENYYKNAGRADGVK
jgi:nitrogen fixation NifU-like protein